MTIIYNNLIDFQDRIYYLSGSELACVVKHYFDYDFATYQDINFTHSIKLWTEEERKQYYEKLNLINKNLFQFGKDWEIDFASQLREIYNENEIEDFPINYAEKSLYNKQYMISATPDFVIRTDNGFKILIELKAGNSNSDKLQQYRYQVATQSLVIPDFDINNNDIKCYIFFRTDFIKYKQINGNIDGFKPYLIKKTEILKMQQEIIESSVKFWEDHKNNNFRFITFEEEIKKLQLREKKTKILQEDDLNIEIAFELQEKIKQLELEYQEIEKLLLEKYIDVNYVNNKNIQMTIKQGYRKVIDKEHRLQEISKKQKEIEELEKILDNEVEIKESKKSLMFKAI